jgi:hypothetical protein
VRALATVTSQSQRAHALAGGSMLSAGIEAGKHWIESTLKTAAVQMEIPIDGLEWVARPDALAYKYYLIVASGKKCAAGEFRLNMLENCPTDKTLQLALRVNVALLLHRMTDSSEVASA